MQTIKIETNLTESERKLDAEIESLKQEIRDLNKEYSKIKTKAKRDAKLNKDLKNIRFAHAALVKKLNKKLEELYGA